MPQKAFYSTQFSERTTSTFMTNFTTWWFFLQDPFWQKNIHPFLTQQRKSHGRNGLWQIMIGLVRYMESPTVWNHLLFGITYYLVDTSLNLESPTSLFVGFLSSSSSFKLWPSNSFPAPRNEKDSKSVCVTKRKAFLRRKLLFVSFGRWGRPRWMIISKDHKAQQMYTVVRVVPTKSVQSILQNLGLNVLLNVPNHLFGEGGS